MMPIHQLLARIRHDRDFARGEFEIGYLDRVEGALRRVVFREITFPAERRRVFEVTDETGRKRWIPFHRVRQVRRDGRVIWQRRDVCS